MTKRAVLYARTSGDDGKNATSSLEGQLELCRGYVNQNDLRTIAELAEDEKGVSGASWDAPKLNQALDMAQAGEFDVLVVRDMDRFARKLAKQLVIEEQFRRAGVDVVYVLEEYADSPEGRLSKHIRATVAEYEREKVRERTTRGRRRSVKHGNVMLGGGGAPFGYRKVEKDDRVGLEIVEDEAAIIRLIFEWYTVDGLSIRAITRRLTDMRIPTPADKAGKSVPKKRGGYQWGPSGVATIINREAYAGTWYYGKYNHFTNEYHPKEHQIAVTVPAIIDKETWQLAQARKGQNKAMAARNVRHDYLMRARLQCGRCGSGVGAHAMQSRSGQKLLYYKCCAVGNGYKYSRNCDMLYFRADAVDAVVWQWVKDIYSNPGMIRQSAELYQTQQADVKKPIQNQLIVTDQLLTKQRQDLERLIDLYLSGDIARDLLIDRKERLEARIKALETERSELIRQLEADTLTDEQIHSLEAFAVAVGKGATEADKDFTARRHVIEMLALRGKLLDIDGVQMIEVACHFNQGETLIVSKTTLSEAMAARQNNF